jgi:aminopeptidase YwaD
MKLFFTYFTLISVILFPAFITSAQVYNANYASVVNQCSSTNIVSNLTEYENLGVKRRGTVALDNTLTWLKNKYLSYGYTASQITEDSYTYTGSTAVCKNLIVTKIGTVYPNTFVIIDGHYDSLNGTGTNDNGSGLVCILEVARLLKNIPTQYSIKFINFSGEEDGLQGSQHFVTSVVNGTTPKMNIKLVFNLDEVGGVAGLVNNTITCERDLSNPTSNNAISNTITNELITCVGLYSPLNTFLDRAYSSDYMPFQSNNEIITGFFERNETTHKHTSTDLLVNMDPTYNYNVAKATIGAMLHFAVVDTSMSNEEFETDFQGSFFPNPTKDFLNINCGKLDRNYTFNLVDLHGKIVFSKTFEQAKQNESIAVTDFNKGMYLAVIVHGNKRFTKKIVID